MGEKKEKRYDINAVDGKTGYNLGHLLTRGLFIEDFWKFFEELREKIYDQCLERYEKYKTTGKDNRIVFVSDRRMRYRNAFKKYFYRVCKLIHDVSQCKNMDWNITITQLKDTMKM